MKAAYVLRFCAVSCTALVVACGGSSKESGSASVPLSATQSTARSTSSVNVSAMKPVTPQVLHQLAQLPANATATMVSSTMPTQTLSPAKILYPANNAVASGLISTDVIKAKSLGATSTSLSLQSVSTTTYAQLLQSDPKAVSRVDVSPQRMVTTVRSNIAQPLSTRAGKFTSGSHVEVFDAASGDLLYAQTIGTEIPDLQSGPARVTPKT